MTYDNTNDEETARAFLTQAADYIAAQQLHSARTLLETIASLYGDTAAAPLAAKMLQDLG